MARHRDALPQLGGDVFLTDGGLETTLVFQEEIELPDFAAFPLLERPEGRELLLRYYEGYLGLAQDHGAGFVLESPTWRANPDWGARLGYDGDGLARVDRAAIALMEELRERHGGHGPPIVISGCVGPRGDGYQPGQQMGAEAARDYHAAQAAHFRDSAADMVAGITLNYLEEAVGLALAARDAGLPVAISFTVETNGRLPTGDSLERAVGEVDARTGGAPAYYMVNCAHPTHFQDTLQEGAGWMERVRGLRANASRASHAELDAASELDAGSPDELGEQYHALRGRFGGLTVLGGCCGTDLRHVRAIAEACLSG
jgi:homocysteine S-methyltransferase